MVKYILSLPISKAALVVGISFITSVVIVTLVDDFLLANFVVPGDTEKLVRDIQANDNLFLLAVLGYLIVLILDAIIGFALYVVLKLSNTKLAFLTAAFRILYAFILIISLLGLAFQLTDVYTYASIKLIGYVLFALHLFLLGYTILKSTYIPKILGLFLILASFTYLTFFIDLGLPEELLLVIMLVMALAELSLSLWLIIKRNDLPRIK